MPLLWGIFYAQYHYQMNRKFVKAFTFFSTSLQLNKF